MSGHEVIAEVGVLLSTLVEKGCEGIPTGASGMASVVLANPKEARQTAAKLSLWLYSVAPNEHLRNAPNVRIRKDAGEVLQLPPLSLNLHYLLTPVLANDQEAHVLLGRAMQVLHDSPIIPLPGALDRSGPEELNVSLEQHAIQELAEVWEALQEPYQLSVCYQVRAVRIPSGRELNPGAVLERLTDFKPAEVA